MPAMLVDLERRHRPAEQPLECVDIIDGDQRLQQYEHRASAAAAVEGSLLDGPGELCSPTSAANSECSAAMRSGAALSTASDTFALPWAATKPRRARRKVRESMESRARRNRSSLRTTAKEFAAAPAAA
eukprot:5373506-Prymnesium_polylepis.1